MNSGTTTDSTQVEALRALARSRGYSEQEIQSKLEGAGLVQPAGSSLGQQFMHGAGAIGRMGVAGLGNLASLPFGAAGAAYQAATGNQPPAMLQGHQGTAAADQLGLPQYQGAGERILGAAGENAVMSAVLPGASAGMAALGAGAGAAGQGAAEAGASPLGQMAASAAVGMGLPAIGMLTAGGIRAMLAGSASRRQAAEETLALMRGGDPNAAVSLGQVTQGGVARSVQGALKNFPGAAVTINNSAALQDQQMGKRAGRIADELSPYGTPATAGAALQRGLTEGYLPNFRTASKQLYNRAYNFVPPETPVKTPGMAAMAAQQNDLAAAQRPLSDHTVTDPYVSRILEDYAATVEANPAGVRFDVLKGIRSRLGSLLDGSDLAPGINLRDVRHLYGVMSSDMRGAIAEKGPEAVAAWDKADQFYKMNMDKIEHILQPLVNKDTPERAFNALFSGSKDGATVLQATMGSLSPVERGIIQSAAIRRMGLANPSAQDASSEAFSSETFLTNWGKIAPESRTALFNGADPRTVNNLNLLAKAAEARRKAGRVFNQTSGTAPNTALWSILVGLPTSLAGIATGNSAMAATGLAPAAAAASANVAARMFTNPRMIDWMVKQTKVPFAALTRQLAILAKDSQKWPAADRDIAQEVSGALGNVDWRSVLLAQAATDQTAVSGVP